MNKNKKYLTGFITNRGDYPFGFSFKGSWGRILFEEHKGKYFTGISVGKKIMPIRHLIIESNLEEKTREILSLIYACLVIINGCDYVGYDLCDIYNLDLKELSCDCKYFPKKLVTGGIYLAGIMAAKASYKEDYVYAIHKLFFSFQTYSTVPRDLDPSHGNLEIPNLKKPYPPEIRILLTNAIISAYSAIEELELQIVPKNTLKTKSGEIRLSKDENGNFFPETKKDIISRLQKAKVNINEPFIWDLRGGKKLFEDRKPFSKKTKKAKWSSGFSVRDGEINLLTALDRASCLRSNVASHKPSTSKSKKERMVKELSMYEVSNVQSLARRLVLESLNLWRVY